MATAQPMWEQDVLPARLLHDATVEGLHDTIALQAPTGPRDIERARRQLGPAVNPFALKLSILMPVYNEEANVARAISEVLNVDYPCAMELIVVDDGSTDGTYNRLSMVDDDRVTVYRHEAKQGKGAALLTAASLATGSYIVPFNADLEYSAEDIPRLMTPVLKGRCSVVYGTRISGRNTVYHSYRSARGNRLLTQLANVLFDACISDLHTCLKLVPRATFDELALREPGFGLDIELTASLLKRGVRPFEVPVTYYSRSQSQGKKVSWRDAVACARILLRIRMWSAPAESADRQRQYGQTYDAPVIVANQPTMPGAY